MPFFVGNHYFPPLPKMSRSVIYKYQEPAMETKMYTNFPVNFVSYTHSGNGCLSLSLKNPTPRKEISDFLKKIEVGTDRTMLVFNLEGVVFRGIMRSIISRKTSISFTTYEVRQIHSHEDIRPGGKVRA